MRLEGGSAPGRRGFRARAAGVLAALAVLVIPLATAAPGTERGLRVTENGDWLVQRNYGGFNFQADITVYGYAKVTRLAPGVTQVHVDFLNYKTGHVEVAVTGSWNRRSTKSDRPPRQKPLVLRGRLYTR